MSYKALYRTYRPALFSQVAGQESIIKTLQNALQNKKTSHAYLFSGPRGIGKTTVARLFAKALNCEMAPTSEPCNVCSNCLSIINNQTTDIIELDAASNNGVDEIRQILEKVNFMPSHFKYKVYIIDEVHMLSTSAFNALLKTLEEPPAHVVFILATTEPHKIPMTILSRCQRFDFKPLTAAEIKDKLKEVAQTEKIEIEEEALEGIAEVAEGGMRDALSVLDQVIVFSDATITIDDVNSVTGRISSHKLMELVESFSNKNALASINIVNELLDMGKEVSRITGGIINFCRDILLYQNNKDLIDPKSIYQNEQFIELTNKLNKSQLFFYIDELINVQNKLKFTNSPKIYLEVGIMKVVNADQEDKNLASRVYELEEKIKKGGPNQGIPSAVLEKISILELRVNKITSELTSLNLFDLEQKVKELMTTSAQTSDAKEVVNGTLDGENMAEIFAKINDFEKVVSKVEIDVTNIKMEQMGKATTIQDFSKQITELSNRIDNILTAPRIDDEAQNIEQTKVAPAVNPELLEDAIEELQQLKANYLDLVTIIQRLQSNAVSLEQFQTQEKLLEGALGNIDDSKRIITEHTDQITSQSENMTKLDKHHDIIKQQVSKLSEKIDFLEGSVHIFKSKNETVEHPFKDVEKPVKLEVPATPKEKMTESVEQKEAPVIYDVRIIEEILHSSRETDAREERVKVMNIWPQLEEKVSAQPNLISTAKLLKEGVIAAVGSKSIILAYPNATICNYLMTPKHHELSQKVLTIALEQEYNFMALPENTWQEKRTEYRGQYNMGVRFPKLSPIRNQELKSINLDSDTFAFKPNKTVEKAEELFGKNLVKVED